MAIKDKHKFLGYDQDYEKTSLKCAVGFFLDTNGKMLCKTARVNVNSLISTVTLYY